jgi:hypothetical protein
MAVLRDISIIFLVAEALLLLLIPLALFGGLVYGLWWLRKHENLPTWLGVVRDYFYLAREYVELAMGVVVRPVFAIHSALATIQGWLKVFTQ